MDKLTTANSDQEKLVATKSIAPGEIVIGELIDFNQNGEPLVTFPEARGENVKAISTLALNQLMLGRQLALLFANGDINKPIVMGVIHNPLQELLSGDVLKCDFPKVDDEDVPSRQHQQEEFISNVDGERLVLEANKEIVLKCGESSITLTKAGKILIRGKYLLNRSSGVNRIMGASVQVN